MKKKVMRVGNSLGLIFNKNEVDIYNLKSGDIIYIDEKGLNLNWSELERRVKNPIVKGEER